MLVYCQRKVIIDSLLDFASYAFYYINIEVTYELLILEIIADNPSVDFGMPGELVYFVEQFYKNGYEELLIASVSEKPTPHNIWMLHRCYNDINNPQRDKFAEVIRELKNEESISVEIKDAIDEFDWE
mgnify:CR=1 FL=1